MRGKKWETQYWFGGSLTSDLCPSVPTIINFQGPRKLPLMLYTEFILAFSGEAGWTVLAASCPESKLTF